MFLADFSDLRKTIANKIYKEEPKKESELKRWGRAGALMTTGAIAMPVGAVVGGVASGLPTLKKHYQLAKLQNKSFKLSTDLKLKNISKKLNRNTVKRIASGAVIGSGLSAAGAYGAYRGGKALINKFRGKRADKQ